MIKFLAWIALHGRYSNFQNYGYFYVVVSCVEACIGKFTEVLPSIIVQWTMIPKSATNGAYSNDGF